MTSTRLRDLTLVLLGLVVTLFINYHWFLADFNLVPGDRGDTRLMVFTLEHWLNVFRGHDTFFLLNMFFPDKLALGYADGLFLFAFPYAVFRLLGLDYFTSYQLLFVSMTMFGYAGWALLLRRALRLDPAFGVLGAVLLTSLNSVQFQAQIGKLLGFYFYPPLIGVLIAYARTAGETSWRPWLNLGAFAGGLGLLFFTSYYPAWFFLFTLLLFAAVELGAAVVRNGWRTVWHGLVGFARTHGLQLLFALSVFLVALIPFGITYAPLVLSDSNRSFGLVLEFTPTLRDMINVSSVNYVWSPVLQWAGFKFGDREVQMGSPLLVLMLFLTYYVRRIVRRIRTRPPETTQGADHVFLLSTTAFVLLALIVKFHNVSLWYVIYDLVPGASALRALGRYLAIIDMIVVVGAVYHLNELYRAYKSRMPKGLNYTVPGFAILAVALIVEQANGATFRLDKAGQLAFLSGFRNPGTACKAFFINNTASADLPVGYYELDAMMISMDLHIPTVNGYSGFAPDEAFTVVPSGDEYKYLTLKYLQRSGVVRGVCELDYQSGVFSPVDVAADLPIYQQLNRESHLQSFSHVFLAAKRFLSDKNPMADLYPQYLEEHGYLDTAFGYQAGPAYKWMQDRYWLGERSCGKEPCFGIGIVGTYDDLQGILQTYASQASQIFFPEPEPWSPSRLIPSDARGELLMVFPAEIFGN